MKKKGRLITFEAARGVLLEIEGLGGNCLMVLYFCLIFVLIVLMGSPRV